MIQEKQDNKPWTIKYTPKTSKDIQGHDEAIVAIKTFLLSYKNQSKKALLIHGTSGTGKTSAIHALAKELNYEIMEVNASDFRNADGIAATVGNASKQMSLFGRSKIILVDEVDGLSGSNDRGGIGALSSLIESAKFPIICTAADAYDEKIKPLVKVCQLIEFKTLSYLSIFQVLKKICEQEKISFDEIDLKSLARKSSGDMRGAINDLQSLVQETKILEKNAIEEVGDREKAESMFNALVKIFKATDAAVANSALDYVKEDLDHATLWIDENLPKEYTNPQDLAEAYLALSKADVYKGRIRKREYWRFLVYQTTMMTAGIAVAKTEKNREFTKYSPTTRLLKIWRANMRYSLRKEIAEKIAKATHASKKETLQNTLPFISIMMRKDKAMKAAFIEEFELTEEQTSFLIGV